MTLAEFIDYVRFRLQDELIKVCPVDKGRLRGSIDVTYEHGDLVIRMVDYWKYVEYGTKPHEIKPKDKKALRWNNKKGSTAFKKDDIFAKRVMHPGTKPQPFTRNTLYHKLPSILQKGADKYLQGTKIEVSFV